MSLFCAFDERDGVRAHALPFAFKAHAFGGGGFDGYAIDLKAAGAGDIYAHLRDVRGKLGALADDGRIDIERRKAVFTQQGNGFFQKQQGRNAFVLRVLVREMLADIAHGGSAQQRVGNSMEEHVGVAVAEQTFFIRDIHAAEDEFAAFNKPVRIIAVADAYDAMTSNRSYRGAMDQSRVRAQIEGGRGTQFDERFADIMLQMIDEDTGYNMREK